MTETTIDTEDCTCYKCQGACRTKPGWFLPGEVERVAKHLGTTTEELFASSLMVDYWEADDEINSDTFVLAPAIVGETPGEEYPADPEGTCIFFKNGRCSIHPVKPFECREYLHHQPQDEVHQRHITVTQAWHDHQEQINDLLGRKPRITESYDGGGLLDGLFGGW